MQQPHATPPKFSLRSLLVLITVFAALCALLAAIGVPPALVLLGLALLGGIVVAQAVLIEVARRVLFMR